MNDDCKVSLHKINRWFFRLKNYPPYVIGVGESESAIRLENCFAVFPQNEKYEPCSVGGKLGILL